MADYQIKITAVDNATPVVDKAFKKTQSSATSVSGKIGDRFRDVFENVTQNATGAFGSVAGGLFKLPGPAGIAAAAILAIGGAAVASAKRYAEANAANDTASAQFLANLEGLKKGFGDVVNSVGSSVIPIFNSLAEAFGFAGTKADELDAKRKALFDGLKSQREQINAVIENLTLQRESDGAFKPVQDAAEKLKKLEAERNQLINERTTKEKELTKTVQQRGEFENALKSQDFEKIISGEKRNVIESAGLFLDSSRLSVLEQQIIAAEELLLKEKALFDARNKKPEPDDSLKLELESAKRLGENILATFKSIDEANRQTMKEGISAADEALQRDRQLFEEELFRKRKVLEVSEELRKRQESAYDAIRAKGIAAAQQIAGAFSNTVGGALEQLLIDSVNLKNVWASVVNSMLRFGIRTLFGGGPFSILGFENGGILGKIPQAASGMMVNRDSLIRVGEKNLPEVIIPLAPSKAPQRQKLMQEAGLANNGINITFAPTIYANQADRNFARDLAQVFNAEVKKGLRLQTTQRSNRA